MDETSRPEGSTAITMFSVALISMVASIAVLISFFVFKQLQVFEIKMIAMLTCYDLLWTILNIILPIQYWTLKDKDYDVEDHAFFCDAQGWLTIFAALGEVWWTSMICHQIYITFQSGDRKPSFYYFKWYLRLGILIPFLFATIPLAYNAYGPVRPFRQVNCFVSHTKEKSDSKFLLTNIVFLYIPIWVSFGFNLYTIIKTILFINKTGLDKEVRKRVYYLFIYPFIIFIGWSIPTVKQFIISPILNGPIWLDNLVLTLNIGQVLLNALAYSGQAIKRMMKSRAQSQFSSENDMIDLSCDDENDDYDDENDESRISMCIRNELLNNNDIQHIIV